MVVKRGSVVSTDQVSSNQKKERKKERKKEGTINRERKVAEGKKQKEGMITGMEISKYLSFLTHI